MNDLLQTAITAHGGLKRWHEISTIRVAASITGAIWFVKSQGDYLKNIVMTVETRNEKMITDFPGQAESKSRFRAVPIDKLVDGMIVRSLAAFRSQAVQYRRLCLFEIG